MSRKNREVVELTLDKIVGGGQTIGTLPDGRKAFIWGGLPGEIVSAQLTKKKSNYVEGVTLEILKPSPERIAPKDEESFLSTSPWQIMDFKAEQRYKTALIEEAFELHHITLKNPPEVYTDSREYEYRNKVEFSFWWDKEKEALDLAFFRRGGRGKVPVDGTSLAMPAITAAAKRLRDILRARKHEAYLLKTALIRATQTGEVAAQLYVKSADYPVLAEAELRELAVKGFELIYSDPKSPASVITKRLQQHGGTILMDTVLGVPFTYAAESFFQVNLPVYEKSLEDMRAWIDPSFPTVELYSGVGSIGLTTTTDKLVMVEVNESAVREAERTIALLGREKSAKAVFSPSEKALEYITQDAAVIVDPPRAGLHTDVTSRLLEVKPSRIIYLSCNPATQARDVALLLDSYEIVFSEGYNFFPRTPHIEHLAVLDVKAA